MPIYIRTYKAEEPGPRQWVAILEGTVFIAKGKESSPVCMNFYAATEWDAENAAGDWLEAEQLRLRKLENARLGPQKRRETPIQEESE